MLREVTRAVEAYEAGDTSAAQYVRSLERALRKLDSFAFGVEGKARRGKIVDPELTALRGFVLDAESIIQDLIDDA